MKRFIIAFTALFCMTVSANAMSYEQARQQALFLTDKMAYELNLTEEQYEAAYEINLDYLMSINTYDDLYGVYWRQRNLDLGYVLLDWQFRAYCAASYFYRPLYWDAGFWHFGIYARYPHRDYFFFGRPHFWDHYRGGHSWRMNGGHSWYHGRAFADARGRDRHMGMRNGFDRGDFGRGQRMQLGGLNNNRNTGRTGGMQQGNINGRQPMNNRNGIGNRNGMNNRSTTFGNRSNRTTGSMSPRTSSSTRTTVRNGQMGNSQRQSIGTRSNSSRSSIGSRSQSTPSRSFTPSSSSSSRSSMGSRSMGSSHSSSSFGGSSRGGSSHSGGFSGGSHSGGSRGGSFGGHR